MRFVYYDNTIRDISKWVELFWVTRKVDLMLEKNFLNRGRSSNRAVHEVKVNSLGGLRKNVLHITNISKNKFLKIFIRIFFTFLKNKSISFDARSNIR